MYRLAFHARISTSWSLIGKYSANGRSITTTTFLAAKASTTRPSTRTKTKKMSTPIDLTQDSGSEESDEDLKLAIALSLSQPDHSIGSTLPNPSIRDEPKPVVQPTTTGIMGLDRKQMEEERLARKAQLKRKRGDDDRPISISPPPVSQRTRPRSTSCRPSPLKTPSAETTTEATAKPSQPAPPSSSTPPKSKPTLQYPNGTIKRTWISSHPRTDRDITFSELIDAPNLKSALLSSFTWDFDWLFPHFRTKETKFVLVTHAQNAQHISLLKSDFGSIPNIRLVFPTVSRIGCMHSKLLLLFYASHVRIAIPTANLTSFDWGECGRVENMLFVIDLPPLKSPGDDTHAEQNARYPFCASLMQFLAAQAVPADVLARLSTFDFGATLANNVAFIHSIGGTHADPDILASTGRCGLGSAISRMGLAPRRAEGESIEIDYVSSSVGSLTGEFLGALFAAAGGGDDSGGWQPKERAKKTDMNVDVEATNAKRRGITHFFNPHQRQESPESAAAGSPDIKAQPPAAAAWSTNLRVFFPSARTIATSLGGPAGAGTICFERRWWEGSKFPRSVLRDCVAVRQGVLMHSKVMFVRFVGLKREEQSGKGAFAGWVYVGSANCSESAWGVLGVGKAKAKTGTGTKSKKGGDVDGDGTGNFRLTCLNWECGVVLPVPVPVQRGKTGLGVFDSVLSVPMLYPGTSYEGNIDLEPWFFGGDEMAAS